MIAGQSPRDVPGCCRMAWHGPSCLAVSGPAQLHCSGDRWLFLSPWERMWDQEPPGVSMSCPGVGGQGAAWPQESWMGLSCWALA